MENISLNYQICEKRSRLEDFAIRFTHNVEDANDLVQDTLLKAIRYHTLYKKGTNLTGWLYTIMKNTFINSYHRGARQRALIDTTDELTSHQLSKGAVINQGENKFVMADIHKALAKLQPEHAVPFLRYFEGYKYHEIAEELSIPIGTVKTRIHIARQVLKGHLKMYKNRPH